MLSGIAWQSRFREVITRPILGRCLGVLATIPTSLAALRQPGQAGWCALVSGAGLVEQGRRLWGQFPAGLAVGWGLAKVRRWLRWSHRWRRSPMRAGVR